MEKLTDKVKNEVINYGGMPVARGTVYQIVLEDKGDKKAADYVAFGASYPVLPPGTVGMTMAEFRFTEKHTILPEGWLYDLGGWDRVLHPGVRPHWDVGHDGREGGRVWEEYPMARVLRVRVGRTDGDTVPIPEQVTYRESG